MKLYYAPGACSLSPHIVAHEAGIKLDLEKVDLDIEEDRERQGLLWRSTRKVTCRRSSSTTVKC